MTDQPAPSPAEFAAAIGGCFSGDYDREVAHANADRLMLDLLRLLGYGDAADAFDRAAKWYG